MRFPDFTQSSLASQPRSSHRTPGAPPSLTFNAPIIVSTLLLVAQPTKSAEPLWWTDYDVFALNQEQSDQSPALLGQLRHFAAEAKKHLDDSLAGIGGAGLQVDGLVSAFTTADNHAILNLGQTKYVAASFYDRLASIGYQGRNGAAYPWTANLADDNDYGPLSIGQLKHIFAFDLTSGEFDTNGNNILDNVENQDGDGLTLAEEIRYSSNDSIPYDYLHNTIVWSIIPASSPGQSFVAYVSSDGVLPGTSITLSLKVGGSTVESHTVLWQDGYAVATFAYPITSSSGAWTLVASIHGEDVVNEDPPLAEILPAEIVVVSQPGTLIADGESQTQFEFQVRDNFGEPIKDLPVQVIPVSGISFPSPQDNALTTPEDHAAPQVRTTDSFIGTPGTLSGETGTTGNVEVTARAPVAVDEPVRVSLMAGGLEKTVTIPVEGVTIIPSTPVVVVDGEYTNVTVKLQTNLPDGSELFWASGYRSFNAGQTVTVQNGSASLEMTMGAGPAIEIEWLASIGLTTVRGAVQIPQNYGSGPGMYPLRRVVANVAQEGVATRSFTVEPTSTNFVDSSGTGVEFPLEVSRQVYQHNSVDIKLVDPLGRNWKISLPQGSEQYATLSTSTVSAGGTFTVSSTGALELDFEPGLPYSQDISILAEVDTTGDPPPPADYMSATITFVEPTAWDCVWDSVISFLGGDPKTPYGIGANVAGGILVVGDVGSVGKNTFRALGFSNTPVNGGEVALSCAGLLSELAFGVGEAADVPISNVRAILAFVGSTDNFGKILVALLKSTKGNLAALGQFAKFTVKLVSNGGFFKACRTLKTQTALSSAVRLTDDASGIADDFVDATNELVTAGLGGGLQEHAFAALVQSLDELVEAGAGGTSKAIAGIKSSGKAKEAIKAMARLIELGVSPASLRKMLDAEVFKNNFKSISGVSKTGYSQADALEDLAKVAEELQSAGASDISRKLDKLCNGIGAAEPALGRMGFRYELEMAAEYARQGILKDISYKIGEKVAGTLTDIDAVITTSAGEIWVQAKWSVSAASDSGKAVSWMRKVKAAGGNRARWVGPDGVPPADIKSLIEEAAVDLDFESVAFEIINLR